MADRSIIVIGGGIIGSAVAFELASRGVSVRVFEARLPGQGATQASAGMLAPYTESRGSAAFQALCVEGLEAYDRFVTRVREHAAVPFEYERTGSVEVALDAAAAQHLRLQAATLPPGLQARWLDASEALAEEPALTRSAHGALVIPAHGFVSPAGFTAALVSAASAVGTGFHTGTAVSAVHPRGPGIEITAGEYQAQADAVVGAAVVVAGAEVAARAKNRPVWIKGFGEHVPFKTPTYAADLLHTPITRAADTAFTMSGLTREQMDMVSIYDCYTITVLLSLEDAGFCAKGTGMEFVAARDLTFRGDFPLNTAGGQLGFGQAGKLRPPLARAVTLTIALVDAGGGFDFAAKQVHAGA